MLKEISQTQENTACLLSSVGAGCDDLCMLGPGSGTIRSSGPVGVGVAQVKIGPEGSGAQGDMDLKSGLCHEQPRPLKEGPPEDRFPPGKVRGTRRGSTHKCGP